MSTAVTTFVWTPHIKWAFTQVLLSVSRPYFLLNQRTKRQVEKPLESTAKLVSTAFRGRLLKVTNPLRTSVSSGSDRWRLTELKWGILRIRPRLWASLRSVEK